MNGVYSRAILLCALSLATCCADEPPSGTLRAKAVDRGDCQGKVRVSVEPSIVKRGAAFQLHCEFECTGGAAYVFNGCLCERRKLPAQIVISSADGKLRHLVLPAADGLLPENAAD